MSTLKFMLEEIEQKANNPIKTINATKALTMKKAVGCMLEYCPEELIYAAGMLPVGLWGANIELVEAKKYFPAFFCAPVQQTLEMGLRGNYDGVIDAIMVPILCDALKSAGQNWRIGVPSIPMISFVYPQNRHLSCGVTFLKSELLDVCRRLEEICAEKITDDDLKDSIIIYNNYRATMRELMNIAKEHSDVITPTVRHALFKCAMFVDKKEYTAQLKEIISLLKSREDVHTDKIPVVLTGIILDSPAVIAALEQHNFTVVADDLAQESRQLYADAPMCDDPFTALSLRWQRMKNCSLTLDPKKGRIDELISVIKDNNAQGIVVSMTSFCEPEEYDYPILKNELSKAGIPHVVFEINNMSSTEQAKTRLQAFAELLSH